MSNGGGAATAAAKVGRHGFATSTLAGKTGRTSAGKTFAVPETRDFLENLQSTRHNVFEQVTLVFIAIQVLLFAFGGFSKWYFVCVFALWRLSYNAGIGFLLHTQSNGNHFVQTVAPLLAKDASTYAFLRRHLALKMGSDYSFDDVPVEYNCWLVFRGVVDVILLNDFTAYILMIFAFTEVPASIAALDVLAYAVGILMIVFNWFIKLDALRVVKDYAWYWGDFFFLLDGSLSFDGVFKIAPHPMYSIGYIGYYGLTLISRSYVVLYASLGAHFCQFVFLALVENPHIDKVYNSIVKDSLIVRKRREVLYEGPSAYFRRDLIGLFKNFDSFRAADLLTISIAVYSVVIFCMGAPVWFHVMHCIFWRLVHSFGLGWLLKQQSETKFFTAHFIKFGSSLNEAFANWKSIYNLSLTMTHVSFFFCAMSFYHLPESWLSGSGLLKHTLAILLLALHIWAATEIYEVIQDFGWFYGDFFLQRPAARSLSYSGIYRFVNNPEKVLCHASFWALALLGDHFLLYFLALFSQCATFAFIHYVEQPHMKKIYGDEVRKRAGFEEGIMEAVKPPPQLLNGVEQIRLSGTKFMENTTKPIEQLVDRARPKMREVVHDLSESALNITRRSVPLPSTIDVSKYSVVVVANTAAAFEVSQPITVKFTAPASHPKLDWIGVYPIDGLSAAAAAVPISAVPSQGRWHYLGTETAGEIVFSGSFLPVIPGKYEFRLHYSDNHGILARSASFALTLGSNFPRANPDDRLTIPQLQAQLLSLFNTVFDDVKSQCEIDENTPFADLTLHVSKDNRKYRAQTVVQFIKTVYQVEFAPKILESYPSVAMLACKLHEARILLGADPGSSSEDEEEYLAYYRKHRNASNRTNSFNGDSGNGSSSSSSSNHSKSD